ncbi:MAG: HRDC domain-containing protein [Myxococcota bacterium]
MDTRWIDDDEAFHELLTLLRQRPRYALDTEFVRERSYYPKLALLQLAWDEGIALVDPLAVDVAPLRGLLETDTEVVMHAGAQDLEILLRECGAVPRRFFDTQVAAAFLGFPQASLARLLGDLLDVEVSKGSQLADWMHRPLDAKERRYAAGDVAHLLPLQDRIHGDLGERKSWAREECDRVLAVDRGPQNPETAWWRLKGKNKLRGRARHRAQAVASWRERSAQEKDRPPKFILSDLALLSIVGRPPKHKRDLGRVRGLERQRVDSEGLFGALARAEAMKDKELQLPPLPPSKPANPAAIALALAWLTQLARDQRLDPAVLATRNDVSNVLQKRPSRLDTGWRRELAGAKLEALIAGKHAIRFVRGKLVLE